MSRTLNHLLVEYRLAREEEAGLLEAYEAKRRERGALELEVREQLALLPAAAIVVAGGHGFRLDGATLRTYPIIVAINVDIDRDDTAWTVPESTEAAEFGGLVGGRVPDGVPAGAEDHLAIPAGVGP